MPMDTSEIGDYDVVMLVRVRVIALDKNDAEEAAQSTSNWHDWNVVDSPGGIEVTRVGE